MQAAIIEALTNPPEYQRFVTMLRMCVKGIEHPRQKYKLIQLWVDFGVSCLWRYSR